MINIKFRVKITFGERKKGNEIREQYIEYFKSISNVLHLKKKNIYLFGCAKSLLWHTGSFFSCGM